MALVQTKPQHGNGSKNTPAWTRNGTGSNDTPEWYRFKRHPSMAPVQTTPQHGTGYKHKDLSRPTIEQRVCLEVSVHIAPISKSAYHCSTSKHPSMALVLRNTQNKTNNKNRKSFESMRVEQISSEMTDQFSLGIFRITHYPLLLS